MPEEFNKAVKAGGKVITKKLKDWKYIHLALHKGKWTAGEVHEKKGGK
jgi:hypothetical protein